MVVRTAISLTRTTIFPVHRMAAPGRPVNSSSINSRSGSCSSLQQAVTTMFLQRDYEQGFVVETCCVHEPPPPS